MEKVVIKDMNIEKAIQKGLLQLNLKKEDVEIRIIDEGKKGIFGFGHRDAQVELTKKESAMIEDSTLVNKDEIAVNEEILENVEEIKIIQEETQKINETTENQNDLYKEVCDYLENIALIYGAPSKVTVIEKSKKLIFQMESEKAGLLIGKHGKIINALQVLVQTIMYRDNNKYLMISVNIGDYRQKREEKLKIIADKTAERVMKTKQPVFLEPLPAFERKIIHARLSKNQQILTHSEGKEPYRYLVVELDTAK